MSTIFNKIKERKEIKPKALQVLVHGLVGLSKTDLKSNYDELLSNIQNNKVEDIFELFSSFGMLLYLSKNKIILDSIETITGIVQKNLEENLRNGEYEIIENNSYFDSWDGSSFYDDGSDEMKEMRKYLYQVQDELEDNKLTNEFQELITNLNDNHKTIRREIVFSGKFFSKPFFLDIKKKRSFFNSIFLLPYYEMLYFVDALKERYKLINLSGQIQVGLLPEEDFIDEFFSFIDEEKKKINPLHNPIIIRYNILLKRLLIIKEVFEATKAKLKKIEDAKS